MRFTRRSSLVSALTACALAGLLLIAPPRSAYAVKASAPTCEYGGNTCKTCEEFEVDPQSGGKRCTKCSQADLRCLARRRQNAGGGGGDGGLFADAQALLNAHNGYRAKHCVPNLTWSADLAAAAQAWASGCKMNGSAFVHSGVPGENLHWAYPPGSQAASAAVDSWYNEIGAYNFNNPGFGSTTGHFTQVIWRASTQLGCAKATCGNYDYWVCRYAPAGNVTGQFPANVPPACK